MSTLDRRRFLQLSAAGALSLASGVSLPDGRAQPTGSGAAHFPGRVVRVIHSEALARPGDATADPVPEVAALMVDTALMALTGLGDVGAAWRRFIHPDDRVLLKLNCLGAPGMATTRAVVEATVRGLQSIGVANDHMVVFDQFPSRLRRAGFPPGDALLGVPIEDAASRGYTDVSTHGAGESRFCRALEWATAVVNLPVIKDHHFCGVTAATKNLSHGLIDNPRQFHDSHPGHGANRCTVHADLLAVPLIRDKVRLHLADGLRVMFDGGPWDNHNKLAHNAVYASTDPVALDTVATDVVEAIRRDRGLPSLAAAGRPCIWLAPTASAGLGIHDRARIALSSHELG